MPTTASTSAKCFHCGDDCNEEVISIGDRHFCCEGCKQVYLLLDENNLCVYYNLDDNPGIKARGKFVSERFAYLEDAATINKLVQFNSDTQTNVTFSLPQMHCSSCVFLLENLHRINPGIKKSQTNFQRKEVFIVFDPREVSLRKVVELLAFIGYEPYISLKDSTEKKSASFDRLRIYRIGVAGFCFANIMMLSFPEYFSSGNIEQSGLKATFAWLNLGLSLPVLFYSASTFFITAWKGLRQRFLNIDTPIVLAILVTYIRSYYEIISGQGAGYLDSGTGIVFFMLIGRWFQDKTYDSFTFDRDYKSYFPLGVTTVNEGIEKNIPVTQLEKGMHIIIRNEEMVPADSMLLKGDANVDYSFVSGENVPVHKRKGELVYAGGKQVGTAIELVVTGEVSQSYITQLWNNEIFQHRKNETASFIHPWSRYFTMALLAVALSAGIYWGLHDPSKLLPAVSSVLIVACPCSLLLSATFTYGNMLRIFGKNKMYLKNANVIESLSAINTIVFDKTGTITHSNASNISFEGGVLSDEDMGRIRTVARQSSHPLSKLIAGWIRASRSASYELQTFRELAGKGIEAKVDGIEFRMGSSAFIKGETVNHEEEEENSTQVHVEMNGLSIGRFVFSNQYREGVKELVGELKNSGYDLYLLSGDNAAEKKNLSGMFGNSVQLNFSRSPQQKLNFIDDIQQKNHKVLMLGDGLNDAGALMQSNVGVAVTENTSRFSPACDAILDGSMVSKLSRFIAFARSGKAIVTASFILSILYNFVGLSFAVQGLLSPMVAAILMPASSISIVLLVTLLSSLSAHSKGL